MYRVCSLRRRRDTEFVLSSFSILTPTSLYCKLVGVMASWRGDEHDYTGTVETAQVLLQHRWRGRVGYGLHDGRLWAPHVVAGAHARAHLLAPDVRVRYLCRGDGCDHSLRE